MSNWNLKNEPIWSSYGISRVIHLESKTSNQSLQCTIESLNLRLTRENSEPCFDSLTNIYTRPQRFFSNSKSPQNWPLIDALIWASKLLMFSHNLDLFIFLTLFIWLFECKLRWVHFSACKVHDKVFFALTGVELT